MNYASFSNRIEVDFPLSDSLKSAAFDPVSNTVFVSYLSNPSFEYEHDVDGFDDFRELLDLINDYQSGYHGYEKWKELRKYKFQAEDREKFEKLWHSLNDYQRQNFYDWFTKKVEEARPGWQVPIYLRHGMNPWRKK